MAGVHRDDASVGLLFLVMAILVMFMIAMFVFHLNPLCFMCDNECEPCEKCLVIDNSYYYYNVSKETRIESMEENVIEVIYPQNEFQQIAKDVADDYIYLENKFDCTQFCDEVKLRLEQRGYKNMRRKTVTLDCDDLSMTGYEMDREICREFKGRHDILQLGNFGYLECTNGFVISPQDYDKYGIR